MVVDAVIGFVAGIATGVVLTEYRISRRESQRRTRELEKWARDARAALRSANREIADILAFHNEYFNRDDVSPRKLVEESEESKLEKYDQAVEQIEGVVNRVPSDHSHGNLVYRLEEVSRHYNTEPERELGQTQRDQWVKMKDMTQKGLEEIRESE